MNPFGTGLAFACCLIAASATALVFGPSNLGIMGYDAPSCYPPVKPYGRDEWAIRNYQIEVDRYIGCIKNYVEGAENDIKRIQEAASEAIATAKRNLGQ